MAPTLSFHHSPRLPVAVSLFISPSVTNLHHLPVSNFPLSPPFLYSLAVVLCLSLFSYIPTASLWRSPLFISLSLHLCYFVWLTSVITRLPLVFCMLCVVSLGLLSCSSKGVNPYTCQLVCCGRHFSVSIPSSHLGEQQIYTYTSAHTHTGMPSVGYYMWLAAQFSTLFECSQFSVSISSPWTNKYTFVACLKCGLDGFPNISLQWRPSSVSKPTSAFYYVSFVCQKVWLPAETERQL